MKLILKMNSGKKIQDAANIFLMSENLSSEQIGKRVEVGGRDVEHFL